jgi:hypothetical protein
MLDIRHGCAYAMQVVEAETKSFESKTKTKAVKSKSKIELKA